MSELRDQEINQAKEDKDQEIYGDEDGEEYEDEEDEEGEYEEEEDLVIPDFKNVEQAEQLIKKVMKDKELEYRFLLEIKSKNYDEAEFIAAQIIAKNPNNESVLLFWDMLRKYKKQFKQMDEEERMSSEDEDEGEEKAEDWEDVDEYDYNDGEEYEDEYEVEDDDDGWKSEDEYDTDEKEELEDEGEDEEYDEDEEEEDEEYDEDEEEYDEDEEEYDEEDEEEEDQNIDQNKEQAQNKQQGDIVKNKIQKKIYEEELLKQQKPTIIKKKERNAKSELIQPFTSKTSSTLQKSLQSNDKDQIIASKNEKIQNKGQSISSIKEVKPPLKPIIGVKPSQIPMKSQSISSAFDIKKPYSTQTIPKRPPSSNSSITSQKEIIRPPSSISVQSNRESVPRRASQSARDKRVSTIQLGSDLQKLPPINQNILEFKKSISTNISSSSSQNSTQKRPASKDHRATKSIISTTQTKPNNPGIKMNSSFSKS